MICLNGYTITGNGNGDGEVIQVRDGGHLILEDSKGNQDEEGNPLSGTITGGKTGDCRISTRSSVATGCVTAPCLPA